MVPRRSGLVVWVPEAEPLVRSFRERFDAESVARGVVPHVTVLFPFAPAEDVYELVPSVAELASTFAGFDASLTVVRRFEEHVWLAPSPPWRFVELTEATGARFPGLLPYEGAFENVVPHLTIGVTGPGATIEEIVSAAEHELAPHLPQPFRVEALSLFVEQLDGSWSVDRRFPFG